MPWDIISTWHTSQRLLQPNRFSKARTFPVASFSPRSRVRPRDQVEIAIDQERLHFFDPDTGLAIRD